MPLGDSEISWQLLRRIVQASSREGDWCLDPFAGSGTLGAACLELGRRPVLCDESPEAAAVMHDRLGLPAALDNDANCAVLGEWWVGAARGARHAIGITIGTGIGGGLVLDGKLYHGASDVAGEIGHTTIDTEGRRCKCGNYGCLEAYASGPNIAIRAIEAIEAGAESRLPSYVGGDLRQITAQTVYQAAQEGDELALEVVNDTAKFLGAGIANLVNIFNPEVVVVCGGVTLAGDHLFVPLRREVARRAFKPAVSVCRIVPCELSGTAGVYGARECAGDRQPQPRPHR